MDITKAKKVFELSKDNKKILVTLWEGDKISSCVTEEPPPTSTLEFSPSVAKQYCETCQCDDELCSSYIDYLKAKGYQATEIELTEAAEETLPKFLEQREITVKPEITAGVEPSNVVVEEISGPGEE